MYYRAGNGKLIRSRNIIGIFDFDNATRSKTTREFLKKTEKKKLAVADENELPKSFILTDEKVYYLRFASVKTAKRGL